MTDVSNVVRNLAGSTGGTNVTSFIQRGVDGTALRLVVGRSVSNMLVDSPTGTLVAGKPTCVAAQWDPVAFTASIFIGSLVSPLTDVSTSFTAGSGTHNDAGSNW